MVLINPVFKNIMMIKTFPVGNGYCKLVQLLLELYSVICLSSNFCTARAG